MSSRGSSGGQALAAKVHPLYFRWLGRRGGRRSQFNSYMCSAAQADDPEIAEIWAERAALYHDEKSRVMIELWTPEELADEALKPRRRRKLRPGSAYWLRKEQP
jgi:hypothetical protein